MINGKILENLQLTFQATTKITEKAIPLLDKTQAGRTHQFFLVASEILINIILYVAINILIPYVISGFLSFIPMYSLS